MAYGAYGYGYPSYWPQQPQSNLPQGNQGQPAGGIIWVSGEAGAKAYLVPPNATVQLWDSERQTIYLKSADASGMPSIKALDYTIRAATSTSPVQPPQADGGTNVCRADLDALQRQIDALRRDIESCKPSKEDKDDE